MKSNIGALALLVAALSFTSLDRAQALTISEQVTPQTVDGLSVGLSITTKEVGGMREYRVIVSPKEKTKLSPFFFSKLTIYLNGKNVAAVPIQPLPEGDKIMYWFQLTPDSIPVSMFEFTEQNYGVRQDAKGKAILDADGRPVMEPFIGGRQYWFKIQDFAHGTPPDPGKLEPALPG